VAEPAVLMQELTKAFGRFRAVDGLSLAIPPGEIYGLLGPNGAGKTTALRMLGRVNALSEARIAERLAVLTAALDLGRVIDRRCEALSTGEKQRVSLARAVFHDPPVMILDEPTSGLDVLASRFLRDFVKAERDRGKAIIFSTHYLAEAELLCDRIGLMFRGRLLREGTPGALRAEAGAATLEEAFLSFVASTEGGLSAEARPA